MSQSPASKPSPSTTTASRHSQTDNAAVTALAALNEPVRRRLYEHAASSANGVSRDGAANALGVPRSVAAFHLDKLVEVGLLDAEYRRPPGRGGPGAGRPAKWYRRSDLEFGCAVPDRRYHLAAALFAEAVSCALETGTPLPQALRSAAQTHGRELGAELPDTTSAPELTSALAETLAKEGYEPRVVDAGASTGPCGCEQTITLGNCPFHALAEAHRTLVCSMNLEIFSGLAEAAGLGPEAARLDPDADECCVVLHVRPQEAPHHPRPGKTQRPTG